MSDSVQLSRTERRGLERVGYSEGEARSGTFLAADDRVLESKTLNEQVEIFPWLWQ